MTIPKYALKDSYLRLQCKYRLNPGESLYSVKWYKDGNEFFRFIPRDDPPAQDFQMPGVDIDVSQYINCSLYRFPRPVRMVFGDSPFCDSSALPCPASLWFLFVHGNWMCFKLIRLRRIYFMLFVITYANYDVCLCVLDGKLHGNICCIRTVDFHFVGAISLRNIRRSSPFSNRIAASRLDCRL